VEVLGFVSEKEKIDLLAHCKAVIYPCIAEDFGIVTIEAFASGKPVRYLIVKTVSPNAKTAKSDPTHVAILSEKEWEGLFRKANFVRLNCIEKKIREKLALYYASTKPRSRVGKILNTVKLREYAILAKELFVQSRHDYYFVLRRD